MPDVINLETALINIYEFKIAYDLYNSLEQIISKSEFEYEIMVKDSMKVFKNNYIKKKCLNMFDK